MRSACRLNASMHAGTLLRRCPDRLNQRLSLPRRVSSAHAGGFAITSSARLHRAGESLTLDLAQLACFASTTCWLQRRWRFYRSNSSSGSGSNLDPVGHGGTGLVEVGALPITALGAARTASPARGLRLSQTIFAASSVHCGDGVLYAAHVGCHRNNTAGKPTSGRQKKNAFAVVRARLGGVSLRAFHDVVNACEVIVAAISTR